MTWQKTYTKENLFGQLRQMGVVPGDILMITGDLGKIGWVGKIKPMLETILEAMLEGVGETGSIVAVSFTPTYPVGKLREDQVYDKATPTTSGGFSKLLLGHPKSVRSEHPTHSFVAIGAQSKEILADHNASDLTYGPIGKIIELGGKMVMFGTADSKNGISPCHYAQETEGFSRQNIFKGRRGVYYTEGGEKKLFRLESIGGCSRGFYKFYSDLIVGKQLSIGQFGNAFSVISPGKPCYEIIRTRIKENPRYALCDSPMCATCRGSWLYNKRDFVPFYFRYVINRIKKAIINHKK